MGLAFTACSHPQAGVRLAVAAPLSGDLGPDGNGIRRAVEMAVDEARSAGTLPMPVEVSSYDDKGDAQEAVLVAGRIAVDPAVMAVIGHLTSGCSIEASKVYAKAGIPMITPSATAPELTVQQTRPGWPGARVVFRMVPSDAVQGSYAADFAVGKLALGRMAIIQDQTPYGRGIADEFGKRFLERGGQIAGVDPVSRGQKDFSAVIADLQQWHVDGVLFGGVYTDFGPLLSQARAAGLTIKFFSGDGSKTEELFRLAGAASDGAYLTVSGVPVEDLPSAQDFLARYRARYRGSDEQPRTFDDYGFEAARIVLASLRKSGPDRAKLIEVLRTTAHPTMVGDVVFDDKGDSVKGLITMTRADFKNKSFESQVYER